MRYSNNNDIYESFDRLRALTEADMINNMNNEAQNGNNETPLVLTSTKLKTQCYISQQMAILHCQVLSLK